MRLLQIPNYYYPHTGGIEQVARDIVHSLKDLDIEQKIICFNENAKRGNLLNNRKDTVVDIVDDIEIHRCGCFAKIASQSLSLTYPKELKKLIKEFDPETIIFHYPNPFVASFLLPQIKKDIKFILYWHLDITKQKNLGKLFDGQTIRLLERADVIVATSPNYIEGSKFLSKYKEKSIVIPNCVSIDFENVSNSTVEKAQQIKDKYKNKCICFTVGRHIPYKGLEYLVDASKYLASNYAVLIGGKGPLTEELKEKAKGDKKVEFLGFISDDDLIAYYLACDIITFSSITKNEAFGISLAEGMSFGKPAVTFTIPGSGVNYVNLNNVTGLEEPNGDWKAYADAIMELHDNKDMYSKYADNAKKRVANYFTFKIFKKSILCLIDVKEREQKQK